MVVCVYADYKFTQFQAFAKINCCHYPNLSELSELIIRTYPNYNSDNSYKLG